MKNANACRRPLNGKIISIVENIIIIDFFRELIIIIIVLSIIMIYNIDLLYTYKYSNDFFLTNWKGT